MLSGAGAAVVEPSVLRPRRVQLPPYVPHRGLRLDLTASPPTLGRYGSSAGGQQNRSGTGGRLADTHLHVAEAPCDHGTVTAADWRLPFSVAVTVAAPRFTALVPKVAESAPSAIAKLTGT